MGLTLREVVSEIASKSGVIAGYDAKIMRCVQLVEDILRQREVRTLVKVFVSPGVSLGWSSRKGVWRLVVVDDVDSIPLLDAEPEERVEVFATGAIIRLVQAAGLVSRSSIRS